MNELGRVAHSFCDIFDGAETVCTEMNHSIHRIRHTTLLETIFKRSSHIGSFVGGKSQCVKSSGFVMQLYFNDLGENFPQMNNNNNILTLQSAPERIAHSA